MNTPEEQQERNADIESAIERVKRYHDEWRGLKLPTSDCCERYIADLQLLADAHIDHLDAEAELRRERAEPVSSKWMDSLSMHRTGVEWYLSNSDLSLSMFVRWFHKKWRGEFNGGDEFPVRNKGQILDLLSALKGELQCLK